MEYNTNPANFYTFNGSCVYTAQGEIVCHKNQSQHIAQTTSSVETFALDETPNMPASNNKNDVVAMALSKGYCKVNTNKDPKTGEIKYEFVKDC